MLRRIFLFVSVSVLIGVARAERLSLDANDTTTPGTAAFTASGNGGVYQAFTTGSGSGVYTALYRIQANSNEGAGTFESGYNWDYVNGSGGAPFDQKTGVGILDLDLGQVPMVTINGGQYLQFLIDLNENDAQITLTEFRVYIQHDNANGNSIDTRVTTEAGLASLGTIAYDLDYNYSANSAVANTLDITPKNGSGTSDISVNIPLARFLGFQTTDNVYIWMKFTNSEAGFEEAAIYVGASNTFSSLPEPGTGLGGLLMLGMAGSMRMRRRTTAA